MNLTAPWYTIIWISDPLTKYFVLHGKTWAQPSTLSEPLNENGKILFKSSEELSLHPSALTFLPHSRRHTPVCGWRQVAWAVRPICDLQGEISGALVPGHLGSVLNAREQRRGSGKIQPRWGGGSLRNIREQGLIILYPFSHSLSLFIHLNSSAFAMCCKLTAPHVPTPSPECFLSSFWSEICWRARFAQIFRVLYMKNARNDVERLVVDAIYLLLESKRLIRRLGS